MEEEERESAAAERGLAEGDDVEILDIEAVEDEGPGGAEALEAGAAPAGAAGEPTPGAELAEIRDRYLRLLADFDNYRKRAERERGELGRFALAEPVRDLLPVVDNLARALAASGPVEDLRRGVEMTARQLAEVLRRYGVEEITAVGRPFDPHVHEAMATVESDEVDEPTVIEELQRGYLLRGRLLRPALVRVAIPPEHGGAGEGE